MVCVADAADAGSQGRPPVSFTDGGRRGPFRHRRPLPCGHVWRGPMDDGRGPVPARADGGRVRRGTTENRGPGFRPFPRPGAEERGPGGRRRGPVRHCRHAARHAERLGGTAVEPFPGGDRQVAVTGRDLRPGDTPHAVPRRGPDRGGLQRPQGRARQGQLGQRLARSKVSRAPGEPTRPEPLQRSSGVSIT
jgi:hypothetical protein